MKQRVKAHTRLGIGEKTDRYGHWETTHTETPVKSYERSYDPKQRSEDTKRGMKEYVAEKKERDKDFMNAKSVKEAMAISGLSRAQVYKRGYRSPKR